MECKAEFVAMIAAFHKPIHGWHVLLVRDTVLKEAIMAQNFPNLCLCYTRHAWNSQYKWTFVSLHLCQNINFSMLLLLMFRIHTWQGSSHPWISVHILNVLQCEIPWSIANIPPQQPYHFHSTNCIYIMNVSMFLMCKQVRQFFTPPYRNTTQPESQPPWETVYKQKLILKLAYCSASILH